MSSPKDIIAESKMSRAQIIGVAICMVLNALDGFDILSISFAAPGIASQWGLTDTALGFLLATELAGMTLGSLTLGPLADRLGRRTIILICLNAMAVGMLSAAAAPNLTVLIVARIVTGLGIGGMLASLNAMSAEYSNAKNRTFCISMMAVGYPTGAMVGGFFASMLLAQFDWRSVFWFGGAITAFMIPVVFFFLPESIEFLQRKRPANALAEINRILKRFGHATVSSLPAVDIEKESPQRSFLSSGIIWALILMTLGYFAHMSAFYFMVKWIPKIVFGLGFTPAAAGGVLVWTNAGGAIGSIAFGFLSRRFDVKSTMLTFLIIAAFALIGFGQGGADIAVLSLASAFAGFFIIGSVVGIYGFLVQVFPTEIRAGCTGIVIGFGRGGAILGPVLGGYLFDQGLALSIVAPLMAAGPVLAALSFFFVRAHRNA